MQRESLPPDVQQKLDIYKALLIRWQEKINLISPHTIDDMDARHFQDSLQLSPLIPQKKGEKAIVFDIGSGAGFPGMVLAIARPDLDMHLIESDQKKCAFLKAVSRETDIPVSVHTRRIEDFAKNSTVIPDYITARALAPLPVLLQLCRPWIEKNPYITMICPKGRLAEEERAAAMPLFTFACISLPSITDNDSQILVLKEISACE